MYATIHMKNGDVYHVSDADSLFETIHCKIDGVKKTLPNGVPLWERKFADHPTLYMVKTANPSIWLTFDYYDVSHIEWKFREVI